MKDTMKAITIASPGAHPRVANDLPIPTPGDGQILVKSIYTAINPVDTIMTQTGAMVLSFPFSPGCDAGGVIISTGLDAISPLGERFEEGDRVCGCTRLGTPGHSPWSEYFLMEARVAIPVPPNLALPEAASLGVGLLTAAEGAFSCLGLALGAQIGTQTVPSPAHEQRWALVLGGASSVGFNAVQLLLTCGLRVVATCSERSNALLEGLGAVCVSHALPSQDLVGEIVRVTGGGLGYVFDAVGANNNLVPKLVEAVGGGGGAVFTTTNAFEPLPSAEGMGAKAIQLGPIGQPGLEAKGLNDAVARHVPVLYGLLESGSVRAGPYQIVGEGVEAILEAWEVQKSGKVAGKVVVKIADE